MKTAIVLAGIGALALPLLHGCADPSHSTEATDLRDRLADLPGVVSVDLDYAEPQTLDSGKVMLRAEMDRDAGAAEVAELVRTAYAAFADVHEHEEGDLDVTLGDDLVHLRSFEPEADPDDVADAAERAVAVLPDGVVRVDINTQDVAGASHVETHYDVTVAEPGFEALRSAVATLERRHGGIPEAGWTVRAGDEEGWGLNSRRGFPRQEQQELLERMRQGVPAGATVWLGDDSSTTVHAPAAITREEVSAMVGRHLDLLGDRDELFYDLEQGGELLVSMTAGECFFDTGAVGARLERDHGEDCGNITHP